MGNQLTTYLYTDPQVLQEEICLSEKIVPPSTHPSTNVLRVISFNVPTTGPNWTDAWKYRVGGLCQFVSHHHPDIIAFQEPHKYHAQEMAAHLPGRKFELNFFFFFSLLLMLPNEKKEYDYYGVGRGEYDDDEYSPVFFLKER